MNEEYSKVRDEEYSKVWKCTGERVESHASVADNPVDVLINLVNVVALEENQSGFKTYSIDGPRFGEDELWYAELYVSKDALQ